MKITFRTSMAGHNGLAVHSKLTHAYLSHVLSDHQLEVASTLVGPTDLLISNHFLSLCLDPPTAPKVAQFIHNSYPFFLDKGVSLTQIQSALDRCDILMFVSRTVREEFLDVFNLDPSRCYFVPNCSRFEASYRERVRTRPPRKAAYIGSIQARKGYDFLCDVAPLDVSVDVYGPATDKELERRLKRTKGIRVRGVVDHDKLGKRLPKYDCLILLSYAEGCPYVLIEAASLGIPCFCSDVNGNREVVIDGVTGNTFSHQENNFAARWAQFMTADHNSYASSARKHYLDNFSLAAFDRALGRALRGLALFPELEQAA